jgi:predicted nucleotidyltransferase
MGPAVKKSVAVIREAVGKITQFYCMAVFGSCAVQEQGKASDLDVAVIVESAEKRELIEAALAGAAQKTLLPIDAHVITRDEFIEMLANDDENLGKQIARKHLAVHNNMIFYSMVREGMKRGFDV